MRSLRILGLLIVVLLFQGVPLEEAQAVGDADHALCQARVIQADIKGFVFYADGKTPAAKVPVRVWDVSRREFIFETETNDYGFYQLPHLEPGDYYLTFDWTRLRIMVVENGGGSVQQAHHVIVVIPRDVGFVALPQLTAVLFATTLTEKARQYEEPPERPPVVSP